MSGTSSCDTELAIRPAVSEDFAFLRALSERVFLAYGSYDRYLDEWFHHRDVSTYIAEVQGQPVGFFMLAIYESPEQDGKRVANLLAIAVDPERQRRGVGRALLGRAIALAREASPRVREMHLSVADGNARAQRLFARSGFRFGPGAGIYPAGQRALFMIKSLEKEER